MDDYEQKFLLPQSAVYKQWHYIGVVFFLKTSQNMGGGVVYKNLFHNWTTNLHIPFKTSLLGGQLLVSQRGLCSMSWFVISGNLSDLHLSIVHWLNTAVNDRATKTLKKVLVVYLKESLQLQHSLEA
jgi:hypothetical protein